MAKKAAKKTAKKKGTSRSRQIADADSQAKLDASKELITQLEKDLAERKNMLATVQNTLKVRTEELTDSNNKVKELEAKIEGDQGIPEGRDEEIANLQRNIQQFRSTNKSLADENEALKNELEGRPPLPHSQQAGSGIPAEVSLDTYLMLLSGVFHQSDLFQMPQRKFEKHLPSKLDRANQIVQAILVRANGSQASEGDDLSDQNELDQIDSI